MRATLPARPDNRTGSKIPRLALVATAVLTVPAFLVGPSAAGTTGTTPAAATATSSAGTASTGTVSREPSPAATPATPTAPAPTAPGPTASRTTTRADGTTAGLTAEPARPRTATVTRSPWNPRFACGGALTFGKVETCASISYEQKSVWTFTTTADSDLLYVRLREVAGVSLSAQVTGRDGEVLCHIGSYLNECQLGAAGAYTLTVTTYSGRGQGSYTLAVESRRTPSECELLPEEFFSFASPGVTKTLPAGAATHCYAFDQPLDSVVMVRTDLRIQLLDGQHEQLCGGSMCTLSRPGPYRLFLHELYGGQKTYTLTMPRLSQAVGCPALPLAPFGDPGAAVGQASVLPDQETCHTLSIPTAGPVTVRFSWIDEQKLLWTLYDDAGQQVCSKSSAWYCALPTAERYTLLVRNEYHYNPVDYQVAVTALHRDEGCAPATGTSWDQSTLHVPLTSPVQTNCQPFQGNAGDQVITYDFWKVTRLVDESGAEVCAEPSGKDGCLLPADGTYRVISLLTPATGQNGTYQLQVRRLSDAVGCPTVAPISYGAAPAVGGIRCRSLDIPAAGEYRIHTVDANNHRHTHRVFDQDGQMVCDIATGWVDGKCMLPAAGRYTLVLNPSNLVDNAYTHAVALLPAIPSGCATVSDTGWRDAPHRGGFQGVGQVNCLRVPSPAGSRITKSAPGELGVKRPTMTVVDATGTKICGSSSDRGYTCRLNGQAPFFALLDGPTDGPTSTYAMAFSRIDGPPACPVLPRDVQTTLATGPDRFTACFSIPADQHAARESFTWARTSGTGTAEVTVFDSQGVEYCSPMLPAASQTITCTTLPDGPLTVLVETDGATATYGLTHREASAPTA
ncbi:hypothetical protein GA0070609_5608 [Micromonospora echinaurantiaca]|uniref:Uncharacterized protein n=1 Tax=Micromonospora echinaurantiaca TaxID=47857 RepID=A0A1C5K6V1_9ACTN|nr:hypothetical protein [Micromonospora echinaurantiaca]SCG78505.1 hypothetical protein GA0070609_5608 [Micromonospora echinaurantiaca]